MSEGIPVSCSLFPPPFLPALYSLPSFPLGTKLSVVSALKSKGRMCRGEKGIFLSCASLIDTTNQLPESQVLKAVVLKACSLLNKCDLRTSLPADGLRRQLEILRALPGLLDLLQEAVIVEIQRGGLHSLHCPLTSHTHTGWMSPRLWFQRETLHFFSWNPQPIRGVWCDEQLRMNWCF